MTCNQSCGCHDLKSSLLQNLIHLQQRILISPGSIYCQRDCFLSFSVQSSQFFRCDCRNPSAKDRCRCHDQVTLRFFHFHVFLPQIQSLHILRKSITEHLSCLLRSSRRAKIIKINLCQHILSPFPFSQHRS